MNDYGEIRVYFQIHSESIAFLQCKSIIQDSCGQSNVFIYIHDLSLVELLGKSSFVLLVVVIVVDLINF